MKKKRYYTVIKKDGEWERTDKRGYGDKDFATFNAESLSMRDGGLEVGILYKGEILAVYYQGKAKCN